VTDHELRRIRLEYDRRDHDSRFGDLYTTTDPANAAAISERRRVGLDLLSEHGFGDLASLRILDIGCGAGGELQRMVDWGAKPESLVGIDLLPLRVRDAVKVVTGSRFAVANAAELPFPDARFDLALLFTVLSSVLDSSLRVRIGTETARVVRPGGGVLWYDFRWNPTNRQTLGIGPGEMRRLFPGFHHFTRRVTLAPPIARAVTPRAPSLASAMSRLRFLRSHTIGLAIKPEGVSSAG
jgi:SAM-dependent methyltransferase